MAMNEDQIREFKESLEEKGLDEVEELQERGVFGHAGEMPDLAKAFIVRKKREAEQSHQQSALGLAKDANRIAQTANRVAFAAFLVAALALLKAFGFI